MQGARPLNTPALQRGERACRQTPRCLEMPPTRPSRQSVAKIPAKCPRPSAASNACSQVNRTSLIDYSTLKRSELQQHCKKLGLRATGKNAELIERLEAHSKGPVLKKAAVPETAKKTSKENPKRPKKAAEASPTVSNQDLLTAVKTEPTEEKVAIVQGWCVVHGMILYRPSSSWTPLLLRGGQVYVQDGENLVPFHLPPLNHPVPHGLSDNYICEDCVVRNRGKPRCCPLCHQTEGRRSQHGSAKKGSRNSRIPIALQLRRTRASLLQISDFDQRPAKDRRRTVEIRKLYQPQEDEAYAQRVDGILSLMARGELGMDRALRPLQPLVVHSPSPFEK